MFLNESRNVNISDRYMQMIEKIKEETYKETGHDIPVQILIETCIQKVYEDGFKEEDDLLTCPTVLH